MSFVIRNGGCYSVFSSGGIGEKTQYGQETVGGLNVSSSLTFDGTTVKGCVNAGGSIRAHGATLMGTTNSGGSTKLSNTTCSAQANSGGSMTADHCTAPMLSSGGSMTLNDCAVDGCASSGGSMNVHTCSQLGSISAGGSLNAFDCPNVREASAGGVASLHRVMVAKNVQAGGGASIDGCTIGGELRCSTNDLKIEGSKVNAVHMSPAHSMSVNGGSIVMSGSTISLGGMSFGGNADNVWINGVRLSDLQRQQQGTNPSENSPKQVLELRDSTVGDVTFEGGKGEVVLLGDSKVTGTISGGKIKE